MCTLLNDILTEVDNSISCATFVCAGPDHPDADDILFFAFNFNEPSAHDFVARYQRRKENRRAERAGDHLG